MHDKNMASFTEVHSEQGHLHVREDLQKVLERSGLKRFEDWMGLPGIEFREVSMRPTRPVVALDIGDLPHALFLKRHLEAPRVESFLERTGIVSAQCEAVKEFSKLHLFTKAGIKVPEVVAWGEGTWEGVRNASFLATFDLEALPLERYLFHNWKPPVKAAMAIDKRGVIKALAALTRRMHGAGLVHRDFYLGHVFIHGNGENCSLSVIDVQRASQRPSWWLRSRIKDLASLHFSSDPQFIRTGDRLVFLKTYWETSRFRLWHRLLILWIERKAARIRRHTEKSMGIPYQDFFENKYY